WLINKKDTLVFAFTSAPPRLYALCSAESRSQKHLGQQHAMRLAALSRPPRLAHGSPAWPAASPALEAWQCLSAPFSTTAESLLCSTARRDTALCRQQG